MEEKTREQIRYVCEERGTEREKVKNRKKDKERKTKSGREVSV